MPARHVSAVKRASDKQAWLTRSVLITGPTPGGIGAETAISLAVANPKRLILAGRSQTKIQPLIDQIKHTHPNVQTSFVELNLASQKSVRKAAVDVKTVLAGDKIDVLILNAAVMACPYALTEDGVESQFGTNHLGHFLFSNLLLQEELVRSRLVVVSSSASERQASSFMPHLRDITYDQGKSYDPVLAYGLSKACNILYAKRLDRLLKHRNITTFSLNPGSIKTNLQGHLTEEMRNKAIEDAKKDSVAFVVPQRKDLQQGCATQLRAALDPSLDSDSGGYLDDCQVKTLQVHKDAEEYMDEAWELSEKLVGEKFEF